MSHRGAKKLANQTNSYIHKEGYSQLAGQVTWDEKAFSNENDGFYTQEGGLNARPDAMKYPILLIQAPEYKNPDYNKGRVPNPSLEDLWNNKQRGGAVYLDYDFETPKRAAQPGYNQVSTEYGFVPDYVQGQDDAGFYFEQAYDIQHAKSVGELFPEHARVDFFGGSSVVNYPMYSVEDEPILGKKGIIRFDAASQDSVQKLQVLQYQKASDYYQGVIARKNESTAGQITASAKLLGV